MECRAIKQWLEAHLDGKLEFARQLEMEAHLAGCPSCQKLAEGADKNRPARMRLPFYRAPQDLKASIRVALQNETRSERDWFHRFRRPLLCAAAAFAVSMIPVFLWMTASEEKNRELVREAVANHARSLLVDHAVDVNSSNQQKIRPWFTEKLNYSPPVADLADVGFELRGGRIDILDKHPVAAIVYQHANRLINVFVWPASRGTIDFEDRLHRGYLICGWNNSGLNYIVVADLSHTEMEILEDRLRDRIE